MRKVIRKRSTTKKPDKKRPGDKSGKKTNGDTPSTPLSKEQIDDLLNNDDW